MTVSSPYGLKTQWEKDKLLAMRNFSFSHSVFKRLVLQTRENQGLFGKGLKECWKMLLSDPLASLTHSHTMTPFDAPGEQAF